MDVNLFVLFTRLGQGEVRECSRFPCSAPQAGTSPAHLSIPDYIEENHPATNWRASSVRMALGQRKWHLGDKQRQSWSQGRASPAQQWTKTNWESSITCNKVESQAKQGWPSTAMTPSSVFRCWLLTYRGKAIWGSEMLGHNLKEGITVVWEDTTWFPHLQDPRSHLPGASLLRKIWAKSAVPTPLALFPSQNIHAYKRIASNYSKQCSK